MTTLRPYQSDAVNALMAGWHSGTASGLVVLPTGTGKSLVQAELIRRLGTASDAVRILAVSHVQELIAQNAAALSRLWPGAPMGICSAGLKQREGDARIVFGSIASIFRDPAALGPRHIVLIDEAHLVSHDAETMYGRLLSGLRQLVPHLSIGGLTATPYRLTTGRLTEAYEGAPAVFERVVYEARLSDMIEAGWLSPLTSKATVTRFDLNGVKTRAGEYVAGELSARVNNDALNEQIIGQTLAMASDRKSWLVFAVGHDHARALGSVLSDFGIPNAVILGDTHSEARTRAIGAFRAGRLRALVSVGVLTTGFDAPNVDCILMARPTKSPGLYVQMLGRGMRLAEGKRNCIVLDFAGNVKRLGPVDEIDGGDARGISEKLEAKARECPVCATLVSAKRSKCPDCGHVFSIPRGLAKPELSQAAVVSSEAEHCWFDVERVTYARHEKDGRQSLRVMYEVEGHQWPISEFHGFSGSPSWAWRRFWEKRSTEPLPDNMSDALAMVVSLPIPCRIWCRRDGKFWNVRKAQFDNRSKRAA